MTTITSKLPRRLFSYRTVVRRRRVNNVLLAGRHSIRFTYDCTHMPSFLLRASRNMAGEDSDVEKVLFSEETIRARIRKLGVQLAEEYKNLSPVLLCILKGSFLFAADLSRAMTPYPRNTQIDFLTAESYGSEQVSSGTVSVNHSYKTDLTNRHVLLIDDICDTGLSLQVIANSLKPICLSLKTVVLLNKTARREYEIQPDYVCFECPNAFVVGYGMDFDQRYRTLPFIGVLKQSVIETAAEIKED